MVGFRFDGGGEMSTAPGAVTVLFIHGFLDDHTVWADVIDSLAGAVDAVHYDLPGFGTRAVADPSAVSLESLAADARQLLAGIDTPVIVVGQSLGSQVAELVATQYPDQVAGLVLITPVPLGGTRLPEETIAPFRALGGDLGAQRDARRQLSPGLDQRQLDRLTRIGAQAASDVVARYVDIWNEGVQDAPAVSAFTGPVLIIRGGSDGFVTDELLATITPRFPQASVRAIEAGGHWVHVEYPWEVADAIAAIVESVSASRTTAGWRRSFAEQSESTFADEFAADVVLEASTLAEPVRGKEQVAAVLAAASTIYESLEFTEEAHSGSTSYLQWRATAFGGSQIQGVTILDRDASGKVVTAAIHHRPLGVVMRFSAEIHQRLGKAAS